TTSNLSILSLSPRKPQPGFCLRMHYSAVGREKIPIRPSPEDRGQWAPREVSGMSGGLARTFLCRLASKDGREPGGTGPRAYLVGCCLRYAVLNDVATLWVLGYEHVSTLCQHRPYRLASSSRMRLCGPCPGSGCCPRTK